MSNEPKTEIISIAEACKMTTLGRTAIWSLIKDGDFPAPFTLVSRRKALVKSEVEAWIQARIDARDTETSKPQEAA